MKKVADLIPYENNPRINEDAIGYVANSIKEFGFKVPLVIDKHNVIVCGHTRYEASKQLKLKEVPCIIAEDLNKKQIRAFRLADNKVSEKAEWDFSKLDLEMEDLSLDFDMESFGFEFNDEYDHEVNQEATQDLVEDILNLGKAQYDGEGKYDIPLIEPEYELPEIDEWIGFNYVLSDDNPEGKAVHFFIDDYQFERIFNNPDKYIEKLRNYSCVLSPDFSPYGDMPMATQIYNHYRKHWCGRYMQENGITVIPTIRASTDKRSYEWFLDGEPRNSIVAYSSMWANKNEEMYNSCKEEWQLMIDNLKPKKVLVYGTKCDFMEGVDIELIPTFSNSIRERKNKEKE